jgi:hypothetical protein
MNRRKKRKKVMTRSEDELGPAAKEGEEDENQEEDGIT